jgi:hypothetical protein
LPRPSAGAFLSDPCAIDPAVSPNRSFDYFFQQVTGLDEGLKYFVSITGLHALANLGDLGGAHAIVARVADNV